MDDLIRRKDAIKAIEDLQDCYNGFSDTYDKACVIGVLEELPSAQRKGKWIKNKNRNCWYCSECDEDDYYAYSWDCNTGNYVFQDHYCPNCGADMKEGSEDDS